MLAAVRVTVGRGVVAVVIAVALHGGAGVIGVMIRRRVHVGLPAGRLPAVRRQLVRDLPDARAKQGDRPDEEQGKKTRHADAINIAGRRAEGNCFCN
jgi:hypothetical protein